MSPPATLSDAIARFVRRYDSPHSVKSYTWILGDLNKHIGLDILVADITPEHIDDWDAYLRSQPIAPTTVVARHKHVRAFFNWCIERRYIRSNPARFLTTKMPRRQLVSKAIPEDVLLEMLKAVPNKRNAFVAARDTAILALLACYGARSGDVSWCTLDHINLEAGWLVLRVKGGKEAQLPLVSAVVSALVPWLTIRSQLEPDPDHRFVFVNNRTSDGQRYQPLTAAGIQTMVARLSQEVSGESYRPHSIRHWRGQSLADDGVPITVTSAILCHENTDITANYYNQDADRVKRVLEQHQPRTESRGQTGRIIPFPRTG